MKMSRYGLLGMALVITTFVLILLAVAPRPQDLDTTRRFARIGTAIEMYTVRHDGRLPPTLEALAEEELLPADFLKPLAGKVKYLAAGRARDALPPHAIVAVEDPAPVAGSIRVTVLLSDGAVLPIPADAVREAARRPGAISRLESAPNGELTTVFTDDVP